MIDAVRIAFSHALTGISVSAAAILIPSALPALDLDRLPVAPPSIPAYSHEIILVDEGIPGGEKPVRVYLPHEEPDAFGQAIRKPVLESEDFGLELTEFADVPRALVFAAQLERPEPAPAQDLRPNPWMLFGGIAFVLGAGLRWHRLQLIARRRSKRRRRRRRGRVAGTPATQPA